MNEDDVNPAFGDPSKIGGRMVIVMHGEEKRKTIFENTEEKLFKLRIKASALYTKKEHFSMQTL
jgi:hypothetical protein